MTGPFERMRNVPSSSRGESREKQFAPVVGWETVPHEILEETIVNSEAREFLAKELWHLCSPDYIASACRMVVPADKVEEKRRILGPGIWGRAIPLAYGVIPYGAPPHTIVGGTVMGKGSSLSGKYLYEAPLDSIAPWGFFGNRDAAREISFGNTLIESGFRSGLATGYATINSTKLAAWLKKRWRDNEKILEIILRSIDIVNRNGDSISFLIRITGVTERAGLGINSPSATRSDPTGTRIYRERRKAEYARSARLLLENMERMPGMFPLCEPGAAKNVLLRIGKREKLVDREIETVSDILASLGAANAHAMGRVWEKCNEQGFVITNHDMNALCAGKDIDLAFITQDYEELRLVSRSETTHHPLAENPTTEYATTASEPLVALLTEIMQMFSVPPKEKDLLSPLGHAAAIKDMYNRIHRARRLLP